jgi:DNA-directed RNA polymerase specialized sigma24 family protein
VARVKGDKEGAAVTPLAEVLRAHPQIAKGLHYLAHRHTRNAHDAEDLFQETIRIGLSRSDPPDPGDLVAVGRFFGSIMNSLGANRRRAAGRHPATPYDDEEAHAVSDAVFPNPELALIEREDETERRAAKAALRAMLASDGVASQMFDMAEAGVRGSAEFAKRIGCSVEDVYRAQRRITHTARRLKEQRTQNARRAS